MTGFTKLVPEIVVSSVWNHTPEVRCVWIALLATKDKDGNVRGNRGSLARTANVSPEAVDEALAVFSSPDPDSNNQDMEGRRVVSIPGGWHVVSHEAYRSKDYREVEAERKKIYRRKAAAAGGMSRTCPGHVPDCSASASVSASDSIPEGESEGEAPAPAKRSKPSVLSFDPETALGWIPCSAPGKPEERKVCRASDGVASDWEMAIPAAWCDEWREVYPNIDVALTLKEIRQKIRDSKRWVKTPGGMRRFVGDWMHRENNKY